MWPETSLSPFGGGKRAEAEIMRRAAAGQTRKQILDETGIALAIVARILGGDSETEFLTRKRVQRDASIALRQAVFAEAAAREARRQQARNTGTVNDPLAHEGEHPVLRFPLAQLLDVRPFALNRDPCGRCGTRGDVGCRHQRAAEAIDA